MDLVLWSPAHRLGDTAGRWISAMALEMLCMCSSLASEEQTSRKPILRVQQGLLKGKVLASIQNKTKYVAFLGIPNAKPPVGDLKFKVMRR